MAKKAFPICLHGKRSSGYTESTIPKGVQSGAGNGGLVRVGRMQELGEVWRCQCVEGHAGEEEEGFVGH